MTETTKAAWPYPHGHRRHGEPKEPSIAAVWRMLTADHGIPEPTVKQKIKGEFSVEVGDYDFNTKSFPVWLHVPGAAYPEKYAFEAEPLVGMSQSARPRMRP
jgi:hypothetical protein